MGMSQTSNEVPFADTVFADSEVDTVVASNDVFADEEVEQPIARTPATLDAEVFAADTVEPLTEVESFEDLPEVLDPARFVARQRLKLLQTHSSEFGPVTTDRNLLGSDTGPMGDIGFGKNTDAWLTVLQGDTEGELLMKELTKLESKHPTEMGTEEGKALRTDIEGRIKTALKTDEMDVEGIFNHLADYASNDPSGFADLILDEVGYNPAMTLLSVGAYWVGGPLGASATRLLGMRKVLNAMKISANARQRVAAFAAEKVLLRGTGVAATEGGLGAVDQYLRNESIGRDDPLHNVLSTAELGAALGFGMNALGAGVKVGRGALGRNATFEEMVLDASRRTGATESEVIQAFKETMGKIPTDNDIRAVMDVKLDLLARNVEPFEPSKRRQLTDKEVNEVASTLTDDFTSNPVTTRPIGTDAKGKSFFNAKNIIHDIRTGFSHLYGKTREGKLGTLPDAVARAAAFETLNPNALARFMSSEGFNAPKRYAEFLLRMEGSRKKVMANEPTLEPAAVYRKAAENAIADMGGDYNTLLKRNIKQRTFDNIQAGTTYAGATVSEYLQEGLINKMWAPLKDIYNDTHEFVRDVVQGPIEGKPNALVYRDKLAELIRDWDGNHMRGALEIDRVNKWVKHEVKDPKHRDAMSHYLEGNLDEYNFYRAANNLDEVHLTPHEIKVASAARQFMNDIFDMAQKSELLMGFKRNHKEYRNLREKLGKSTDLVENMSIPVKFVKEVAPDGRLAQLTKDGVVQIKEGLTKEDIIRYLTDPASPTARQKQVVHKYMEDAYKLDLLSELRRMSDDDAIRFLVAHEKGHAMQKKTYGKQFNYAGTSGKRGISERYGMGDANNKYLTDRSIKLEADANAYALKHMKDSQKLHDEIWETVRRQADPREVARQYSPSSKLPYRNNYVTHLTSHKRVPTDQDLLDLALDDAHRAAQLQTRSRFTKRRKYDTLMDAIYAGEKIYTQDIAELLKVYGTSMVRSQLNNRLTSYLSSMRTINGHKMIGSKHEVPPYYVKFTHPNFKGPDGEFLYVNPNLAPDLRMYFETSVPTLVNRVIQNIILIVKRSTLGLSFFHMSALAWSAMNSGQSPVQVFKTLVPGMKSKGLEALAGGEGFEEAVHGMRNGLGVGATEDLKGDTLINAMRTIANAAEMSINKVTHFKPLGKMVAAPIRATARLQEVIDTHLWDQVSTGLKITTYLAAIQRLRLADTRRAHKTGTPVTDLDLLRQRAAQFTNDAYGAQNWNQMAMNVRGHMAHRLAAALNKPTTRGYIRMLVFAPDWTLSNIRVIAKGLDVTDKAHAEYMAYSIRSALIFAMIGETLQQTAGEGSIFDDSLKDALRPNIGGGQQIELSKQLSEVARIFVHGPFQVAGHKASAPVKSFNHMDSWGDFFSFWMEAPVPIGVKQGLATGSWSGTFGLPIYNK